MSCIRKQNNILTMTADELSENLSCICIRKKTIIVIVSIITIIIVSFLLIKFLKVNYSIADNSISVAFIPSAATAQKVESIGIPSGIVKANPFLPYRNIDGNSNSLDVPKFDLIAPPETVVEDSDAARVMDTLVSGILFDKFSPSAILNIEGTDHLVKKGDVVNNYKIINITRDNVTVKLGNNTFTAGIGEILTEGELIKNDVSNLNTKFGGKKK